MFTILLVHLGYTVDGPWHVLSDWKPTCQGLCGQCSALPTYNHMLKVLIRLGTVHARLLQQ